MNTTIPVSVATGGPSLDDNRIDIAITAPRHDMRPDGFPIEPTPSGTSPGPRQRRFEFDAKVIRDTLVTKFHSLQRADLAAPLEHCHKTPTYKQCTGCRSVKVFYNRCERFYCPICAARLARDRRESVEWWAKIVYQPKHMVLTTRSVEKLTKAYVRKLKSDFGKLRKQIWASEGKFLWRATAITHAPGTKEPMPGLKRHRGKLANWKGRRLGGKTTKWRGGYWSIDATWHKDVQPGELYSVDGERLTAEELIKRGWHIHFHVIVDADFIDRDELEKQWAKLRGQDEAIVRVYDVRGRDYTAEACKYVCDGVQLGNWPAEKLVEFADALSNERCFDTFGHLYKQRAEWTRAKEEIHADRDVCHCGCQDFRYFDSNEWEWQQIKSDLSPPPAPRPKPALKEPDLWTR